VSDTIHLGGRAFVAIGESTIEHDTEMLGALGRAGLVPLEWMEPGETPGDWGTRQLKQLVNSKELFTLLGCALIPEGLASVDWTPEIGRATEAHVRKLAAPDDKATIYNQVVALLQDFFGRGTALSLISRTSSNDPTTASLLAQPTPATASGATLSAH
jgi:hypothetical protein